MASNPPKKPPAKRKKNGYQMPGHIPKGEVMKDISNNKWVISTSIGIGGFGEIYSASKESDRSRDNYVVKVEPSENGPLFCEKTVYLKIGKKEDIEDFMQVHKLKNLGMPRFFGCGTHTCGGTKYRFLVMERYGQDLWSLFIAKGRTLPAHTVFKIGIQVLDVLEYIHSKSYVHADIKGANLLLGLSKGSENQVYLVDFGLAARYATEYKPNPKKAHNGTLEYTSRDAHVGVTTRRGDIEILGYNLLQWIGSLLPWEKLTKPSEVEVMKREKLKDCAKLVNGCVKDFAVAETLLKYLQSMCRLEPLEQPDYDALRRILRSGAGSTNKLSFTPAKASRSTAKPKAKPRNANKLYGSGEDEPVSKRTRASMPKNYYCENDDNEDNDDNDNEEVAGDGEEEDGDLFKITPPAETKETAKRSWKDAPTIVSCAAVYSRKKF